MSFNKNTNKCFKCGLCRFQCPVYSVRRNDAYSPKGKVLAAEYVQKDKTALLELADIYRECSLCKHCMKICPGEIDTPAMVIDYRGKLNKVLPHETYERLLTNIMETGTPYSSVEECSFRKNGNNGNNGNTNKELLLFLGCTSRFKIPEIAKSAIDFLDEIGIDYTISDNEQCCGNILYNTGYTDEAKAIAKKNVAYLNKYKKILTLCPGCYNMLKNYKDIAGAKFEVFHIAELINALRQGIEGSKEQVYFHVPCHLYNTGEFDEVYLNLISLFENASSSLDVMNSTKCCGAGGGMLSTNGEFVKSRMDLTFGDISADTVITSCPFCYMSFKKNTSKKVSYITEKLICKKEIGEELKLLAKSNHRSKIAEDGDDLNSRSFLKWTIKYKLKNIFAGEKE